MGVAATSARCRRASVSRRRHGARRAENQAHDAQGYGVRQGPIGREPRRDVAAHDAVDEAIDGGNREERVGHRLAHGGKIPIACSAMSVPRDRTKFARTPANTAPRLRIFIAAPPRPPSLRSAASLLLSILARDWRFRGKSEPAAPSRHPAQDYFFRAGLRRRARRRCSLGRLELDTLLFFDETPSSASGPR